VDVVASERSALLLADDDMVAAHAQGGIGLPLVGIVKRALAALGLDHLHDRGAVVGGDRLGLHQAVALDDAEDDDLAGRAPAALALAGTAKGGLVAFEIAL